MEKQQLPNGTMIIVLGILGYVCCCFAGLGIIPSAIAFFMALKSEKLYKENPDAYDNYSQIKTGKIVALIAMILSLLVLIRWIYIFATGGMDAFDEIWRQAMEQAQNQ